MEQDCIFCDRKNFEERLVAEDNEFYCIATLGQITDGGYVLLVPKAHVPCCAEIPDSYSEFPEVLCNSLSEEYGEKITLFEHGKVGQSIKHAHLHFLPAELDMTARVAGDFPTAETDVIESMWNLRQSYEIKPEPYLMWGSSCDKTVRVCWNPPAPPQYLRIVAANLMGRADRANWRNVDPELDKKLWSETVAHLKPYFAS